MEDDTVKLVSSFYHDCTPWCEAVQWMPKPRRWLKLPDRHTYHLVEEPTYWWMPLTWCGLDLRKGWEYVEEPAKSRKCSACKQKSEKHVVEERIIREMVEAAKRARWQGPKWFLEWYQGSSPKRYLDGQQSKKGKKRRTRVRRTVRR